ncbi:S8 family serine peptidase [Glaciimonas immobilis]|uniref:PKD/Chitinase domain-containing protein n=1 Tax=Glaciimonas immobilis TaxID=728004 RepID=A0A840RUU4_9BURK|nr:S8 family serine peptidase [Glaciimonas immobilis]KAF3998721.1 S8 family serine peptidase [Glaciimonas immobilis]MBB5201605.1 hypothetical protein [Glaciimonas immobilis]
MNSTITKLLLCATIGALFSGPLQAKEVDSSSITVLLRTTLTALESNKKLPENTSTALAQLEHIAPRLDAIFPIPMTYSKDDIAAMERHNLTRYYKVDTSDKTTDAVQELLTELKNNPLVELAQITPIRVNQDDMISVSPLKKPDAKKVLAGEHGFPDYTSLQHYKHGLIPEAGYKLGGLNSIAARAYPGGDGEYARVISTEWSHWSYTHADLPRPFIEHGDTGDSTPDFHDTGSAGIMFSKDNGFGTTGFVPKAQAGYSQFDHPEGSSLFKLAQHLQPGDVVQVGIHFGGPTMPPEACDREDEGSCFLPVESVRSVADEISYLTEEKGVHVIIAAGNGSVNLDHPFFEGQYDRNHYDSGAIYAGAADPTEGNRASFSEYGNRVDLFSWGWHVTTTSCDGVDCAEDLYTHTFSGTSSANPIIAGAVAQVQSIAFAHGLGAIPPKKMRQLLVKTGHPLPFPDPQRPIGMQPDVDAAVKFLLNEQNPPVVVDVPEAILSADVIHTVAPTGGTINFALDGSESKGAVKYQWEQLSGSTSLINVDQSIAKAVMKANEVGENTYRLTVTSATGKQSSAILALTIAAPVIKITGPTSIMEGESTTLTALANFAGNYIWVVYNASGQVVMQGRRPELKLPPLTAGIYRITGSAETPYAERKVSAEHNLTIKKPIETGPPTVVVSGPTQATAGTSVTLDASGSSAANDAPLSYSWKVWPQLPLAADGAQVTFTPPALTRPVEYLFTVTASDGKLTSQQYHFVMVEASGTPPPAPVEE